MTKPTTRVFILQDWAIKGSPFDAPELGKQYLSGDVYNHTTRPDGEGVVTSRIVKVEGRFIHTRSGSVYRLGRVERGYRRWMKKEGLDYDRKEPVKLKRGGV